jgi:general stress protein 26
MRYSLLTAIGGLWLAVSPLGAQVAPATLDSIARRIVTAARYATFATIDAAGHPQVRTIQPRAPDAGWAVWFATNPRTRKVADVDRNRRVALHWFDPATESYVAVRGRARVVRDRATKEAHWDAAWNAFYPDRDKDVVLIAVEAERIEVVSPRLGVDSDAATWRPQSFVPPRASMLPGKPR